MVADSPKTECQKTMAENVRIVNEAVIEAGNEIMRAMAEDLEGPFFAPMPPSEKPWRLKHGYGVKHGS